MIVDRLFLEGISIFYAVSKKGQEIFYRLYMVNTYCPVKLLVD